MQDLPEDIWLTILEKFSSVTLASELSLVSKLFKSYVDKLLSQTIIVKESDTYKYTPWPEHVRMDLKIPKFLHIFLSERSSSLQIFVLDAGIGNLGSFADSMVLIASSCPQLLVLHVHFGEYKNSGWPHSYAFYKERRDTPLIMSAIPPRLQVLRTDQPLIWPARKSVSVKVLECWCCHLSQLASFDRLEALYLCEVSLVHLDENQGILQNLLYLEIDFEKRLLPETKQSRLWVSLLQLGKLRSLNVKDIGCLDSSFTLLKDHESLQRISVECLEASVQTLDCAVHMPQLLKLEIRRISSSQVGSAKFPSVSLEGANLRDLDLGGDKALILDLDKILCAPKLKSLTGSCKKIDFGQMTSLEIASKELSIYMYTMHGLSKTEKALIEAADAYVSESTFFINNPSYYDRLERIPQSPRKSVRREDQFGRHVICSSYLCEEFDLINAEFSKPLSIALQTSLRPGCSYHDVSSTYLKYVKSLEPVI